MFCYDFLIVLPCDCCLRWTSSDKLLWLDHFLNWGLWFLSFVLLICPYVFLDDLLPLFCIQTNLALFCVFKERSLTNHFVRLFMQFLKLIGMRMIYFRCRIFQFAFVFLYIISKILGRVFLCHSRVTWRIRFFLENIVFFKVLFHLYQFWTLIL